MPTFEVSNPSASRSGSKILVRIRADDKFVHLRMTANDALEMIQAMQRALIVSRKPRNGKK